MTKGSSQDRLSDAALKAARKGWMKVTPAALAKQARISLREAESFLSSPCQTMRALADYITRRTLAAYAHDPATPPRDALFEILMLRFDVLQEYRDGILAIMQAARRDPPLAAALAASQPPQWRVMLQAARLPRQTPLHEAGMGMIHAFGLHAWRHDASPDLARTMATVDRHLRRAEYLLNRMTAKR